MEEVNIDKLLNQVGNELESLRDTLSFNVDDLSKKELKRAANNMRALLIATLEHPLDATQEVPEGMMDVLEKCIGIRLLQTAITMHAVSDKELGAAEQNLINEAQSRAEENTTDNGK